MIEETEYKAPKRDTPMRSAFCEFPVIGKHPDLEALTEEQICQWFCEKWVQGLETRQAICTYCISENGYHHVHMVLSSDKNFRWSAVKKAMPINGDIRCTMGTKKQALAYIRKEGEYTEKNETVVCEYSIGDVVDNQGMRTDLDRINTYINEGLKPNEIFDINIKYRKNEKIIRDAYFSKRFKETPFLRDLYVEWHVGETATGKTYFIKDLIDAYGEDEVYLVSDYESGGLDKYNGERVLFLDEFRGQIRFSTLLAMLQGYKQQFHARYTNVYGLWSKVYIATVLPPEQVYKNMVSDNRENDTFKQLLRRIDNIVYHYKEDKEYKSFSMSGIEYKNYEDMKYHAKGNQFITLSPAELKYVQQTFEYAGDDQKR